MSIISKISDLVRSLTSEKANEDTPEGVDVPPTDEGPVPIDREPMAGHEPESESS